MPQGNPLLPRALRAVVWLSVPFIAFSALLGAFGPEVADGITLANVTLRADVSNQYANYPWYLRLLMFIPPALAMAYAMARLAALLTYAARGEVFSAPASGHLRGFGLWLLISTLSEVLLPVVAQGLNGLAQSPEAFSISFKFDSEIIWKVFFSTLIMLLARVLSDAYRLAEENRQFV